MQRGSRELWIAFLLIAIVTLIYLSVVLFSGAIPPARNFFGHSLGILGFLLMVMTETLYSWRKRYPGFLWGRMADWLNFHIITGLVGPYMAFLHTAWKFNGLAGLVMILTIFVVLSGFIGRYIYTAVPRRADGAEIEASDLERLSLAIKKEILNWIQSQPAEVQTVAQELVMKVTTQPSQSGLAVTRFLDEWRFQNSFNQELRKISPATRRQFSRLRQILGRQNVLNRQIESLAITRRLLSIWHAVHIPVGLTLFITAFIHIGAAIYFATLLH